NWNEASSKVSGVLLFDFNIPDLIEVRENVDVPIIINRKHPYTEVSTSQKNRCLHSLAKDFKTQSTVILKNNNINNSQLRLIELEIDGKIVVIDFQSHCDAVLRAIDECLIS
ncbi:21265_t:CDS:1, partial [Rhizophagus irregularis]